MKKLKWMVVSLVMMLVVIFTSGMFITANAATVPTEIAMTTDITTFSGRTIWKSYYGTGQAAQTSVGLDLQTGKTQLAFVADSEKSAPSSWGTRFYTQKEMKYDGLTLNFDYGILEKNTLFTIALPKGLESVKFPGGSWSNGRNVLMLRFYRGDGTTKIYDQVSDPDKIYFNFGNISVATNKNQPLFDLLKREVSFAANAEENMNHMELSLAFDENNLNITLKHSDTDGMREEVFTISKADLYSIYNTQTAQAGANETLPADFDVAQTTGQVCLLHYANDNKSSKNELSVCVNEISDSDLRTFRTEGGGAKVTQAADAYLAAAQVDGMTVDAFKNAVALRSKIDIGLIPVGTYRWERFPIAQKIKEADFLLYGEMTRLYEEAAETVASEEDVAEAEAILEARDKFFDFASNYPTYTGLNANDVYVGKRDAEILQAVSAYDARISAAQAELNAKQDYSVKIIVKDGDVAVANAVIEATNASDAVVENHGDGSYTVSHLSFNQQIKVSASGYRDKVIDVTYDSEDQPVSMEKLVYTVNVKINGHAEGVTFKIAGESVTAQQDNDTYTFSDLWQDQTIVIEKHGYETVQLQVSQSKSDYEVTLTEVSYDAQITVSGHSDGVTFKIDGLKVDFEQSGDVYTIKDLRGEQKITVSKNGYDSVQVTVSFSDSSETIVLQKGTFDAVLTVSGHSDGVTFTIDGQTIEPIAEGENYTFADLELRTEIVVSKAGYETQTVIVDFDVREQTVTLIQKLYIATVTVKDQDGNFVKGATVSFGDQTAIEISDGVYQLGGLFGEAELNVSYEDQQEEVVVNEENPNVEVVIQAEDETGDAETTGCGGTIAAANVGLSMLIVVGIVVFLMKKKEHERN